MRKRLASGVWLILLCGILVGCDGGKNSTPTRGQEESEASAKAPPHLPTYQIASELRAQHAEVVAFLDEFLNTCLAGDYAGYRLLVSRTCAPESRERFEAIYHATLAVVVELIEQIEIASIPPPVYLVVSSVELDPQQQVRLRETQRKIAILVFKEDGQWRMAPAPPELQPAEKSPPTPTTAPTSSAPAYPWDEEGDY